MAKDLLDLELKYKNNEDVMSLIEEVKDLRAEVNDNTIGNLLNSVENSFDEASSELGRLRELIKQGKVK